MLELDEALENAKEELKRADHLLYVSLKYTRTVDVIKSIIERLINTFNYTFDALLIAAKEKGTFQGKIHELPRPKAEQVTRVYSDDLFKNYLDFYLLLRKIDKANFDRSLEFRRHVTMTAHLSDEKAEVTIDIINDYFDQTKEFLNFVERLTQGKEDE